MVLCHKVPLLRFWAKKNTCRFLHQQVLSDDFLLAESEILAAELLVSQPDFSDALVNGAVRSESELFRNFLNPYAW